MDVSRVGPFAIEERLPGADNTFRAVHIGKRKSVALKVIPVTLGANPGASADFIDECERLQRLRHSGIVRSFGGGIEEPYAYLASTIVPGESLAALLQRGPLPWQTVVTYAKELALALCEAHEVGIVHELLLPKKVIIDRQGYPRILDFRIRRHRGAAWVNPKPKSLESVSGNAPEFDPGVTLATPKVDLYSLGVIMYRLLTGACPFAAGNVQQLLAAHREQVPARVASIVLECPIWLDAVVMQLLEKDPLARTHSAAAVVLALEETERRVAEGVSVTEQMTRGMSPVRMRADRDNARRLIGTEAENDEPDEPPPLFERAWFLAACLAITLGLGAVGVYFATRPLSADTMMERAEKLLAGEERDQWQEAKNEFLLPLVERYPESPHVEFARRHIDRIDMDVAENRLRLKIKFGREPQNEGERLYLDAWNCEQFGDRVMALEKYRDIVDLLERDEAARVFRNLALRQIDRLEEDPATLDRGSFVQSRLDLADELSEQGSAKEARKIWNSIMRLYKGNQELERFVEMARDRLAETKDGT